MHILDIAENSIAAGAARVRITLLEQTDADRLRLEVADDGRGMDEEIKRRATSPFTTTRTTRKVGLGLPFLEQSAGSAGGSLSIESEPGKGTTVTAEFQLGHIDRIPMGNLQSTMMTLIAGNPDVDFLFDYSRDGESFSLDTGEIRSQLEGVPINHPQILRRLREEIASALARLAGGSAATRGVSMK